MTQQAASGYTLMTSGHRRGIPAPVFTGCKEPPPRADASLVSTACPRPGSGPRSAIGQAFSPGELEQAWRDQGIGAVVHHGPAVELPGFELAHSHHELLAVFAHRDDSVEAISVSRLIDGLLRGADQRDSTRPILRHCGLLNRRALRFALEQVDVEIGEPEHARSFGSYGELAAAGTRTRGSLMVGLRGRNLRRRDLRPVRLEGFCPLARSTHSRYPLQYQVHFYLRRSQSDASLAAARAYLQAIRERMALDNEVFSGRRCERAGSDRRAARGA